MHEIMVALHCIGVALCFYSVYIVVARKNTEKDSYMVVVIVLSTLSLLGYVLEITSTELSAMMVAVKMQYLGKAFMGTFLLLTFRRYYKWNLPNGLMWVFWFIDLIMYAIIFTSEHHKLYYTSIGTQEWNGHVFVALGKSPLYVMFMIYMLSQMLLFAYWCFKQYKKETGREKKVAMSLVVSTVGAVFIILFSLTINKTYYDFVPMTITLQTVVIAILMQRYGLFTTMDMAKEDLITNLNEGVIVKDSAGHFSYANPMAYEMFPEMNGLDKYQITETLDKLLDDSKDELLLKNRYYQVQTRNLYEKKNFAGQIITFFDVTRLHDDTKKMEKLKDEANRANKAKSNFLANMSHEIRTPINAVLGMDEMILRECHDPVIVEYASNIKRAGETLLALVNDVLDLAKIESGKMNLINVEYNLKDMVKNIMSTMSVKMSEKGLKFIVEVDSNLPSILYGDEVRIKQIIMNLLSNGYKYTHEGSVTLKITGELLAVGCRLKVSVIDTGMGIKKEDLFRLFDSFERVNEEENREIEGSGLGLNITNNLLNMMGTKLQVDSVYGRGSEFFFEMEQGVVDGKPVGDIHKKDVEIYEGNKTDGSFKAPKAKLLVVDDNMINLAVIKGLLKRTEIQVETANSGMECLQKIKETEYNLIIMDHLMPDMDGVETLRKIKSRTLHRNENTPIIVLTANAISGAREMYMEYGFSDYLTKPVDVERLEAVIIKFLPEDLMTY